MNKTEIRRTAVAILAAELSNRVSPVGFNMCDFVSNLDSREDKTGKSCGTTACIAGTVHLLHGGRRDASNNVIAKRAAAILGLTADQAHALFYIGFEYDASDRRASATQADAAQTLFMLAETGEVNWDHVK